MQFQICQFIVHIKSSDVPVLTRLRSPHGSREVGGGHGHDKLMEEVTKEEDDLVLAGFSEAGVNKSGLGRGEACLALRSSQHKMQVLLRASRARQEEYEGLNKERLAALAAETIDLSSGCDSDRGHYFTWIRWALHFSLI